MENTNIIHVNTTRLSKLEKLYADKSKLYSLNVRNLVELKVLDISNTLISEL